MIEMIVEGVTKLLGPIASLGKEKRELKDNALRAISHALRETQIYYAGLSRGNNRNTETESQLAKYWSAASIPLRHIDKEFAMVCEHKADYWVNPENWSGDKITNISIQLDNVADAYKKLIKPNYTGKKQKQICE